jgi:predicted membrane metal-binding protein
VARLTGRYHGLGQILLASLVIQLVIDPLAIRSVSFQLSYAAMAGIAFVCPWLQGFWERAAGLFKADEGAASGDGEVAGVGNGLVTSWGTSVRNFATLVNRTGTLLSQSVRWIWNTVALSIACQITTAPLAYMYFGTFPVHFMLTNLLSLPLTGLLIPSALLTVGLSALGCCPPVLIKVTEWLVCALICLLDVISSM